MLNSQLDTNQHHADIHHHILVWPFSSKHLFFKIIIIITVFTYIWVPPHRHDTKVPGTPPKKGMAVVNVTMTRVKMITNMKAVKMRTPTSP